MRLFFFLGIVFGVLLQSCRPANQSSEGTRFTQLSAKKSGINFINSLPYDEAFNVYLYRSFYNGAGTGLGDVNNDGLIDLFLCGNQVDNKLYLNSGNFQFKDITEKAGVASPGSWTTGVSMVDINSDGWLDIFVCKSGKPEGINRHNELFINTGILDDAGVPGFIESAKKYGIDDLGFSVHATFFDYDKDGDLDMYLLNNSIFPSEVFIAPNKDIRAIRDPHGSNKLYRNEDNFFVDVSEEAGIFGSAIGFGLGAAVGDVNKDGWPDIFVANDFFEKDYLYINRGDGTFKECLEDCVNEISLGSMGVDMADINNDGFTDIFVTEMLPEDEGRLKTKAAFDSWEAYALKLENGYYRQYPRNALHLNNGYTGNAKDISFSEVSRYSDVDATDWSWGVFMTDFDNDGFKDIFVTNGIVKDLLDQDYIDFYVDIRKIRKMYEEKGAVIKDLVDNIPSEPLSNFMFTHNGNMLFSDVSAQWGLAAPGFSTGAAYGDIDNDGDLDLVVNNLNAPPFVYRNESNIHSENHFLNISLKGKKGNLSAIGSKVSLKVKDQIFYQELFPMRGTMSSVDHRLHFGLGTHTFIDTLEIVWPDGSVTRKSNIPGDEFITFNFEDADKKAANGNNLSGKKKLFKDITADLNIHYDHSESQLTDFDRDKWLYQTISNEGPKIAVADINNDGLSDFYIGGAKDKSGALFIQESKGQFAQTGKSIFEKDKLGEDTDILFFDADNDSDQDLLIGSGSYEFSNNSFALADRLYINDNSGSLKKSNQVLPANKLESTSCLKASDFDNDGDQDLFVGIRLKPFLYGIPATSYLLENDGSGNFSDITKKTAPGLLDIGMVTDALWMDYDKDGDEDLFLVGDWMPVKLFENNKGQLLEIEGIGFDNTNGFWNVIEAADLDKDGDLDLIAGNLGTNTILKATPEKPVEMYINDFDNNGKVDKIITSYRKEKAYPLILKNELIELIPNLRSKYPNHRDYKEQTIRDIFTPEQLEKGIKKQVFQTETVIFWNEGNHFSRQALPMTAQLAPIYAVLIDDFDQDGNNDILLGGNLFDVKPEEGSYGATHSVLLRAIALREFEVLHAADSGLFIKDQIRDLKRIMVKGRRVLLVGRNDASLLGFEY